MTTTRQSIAQSLTVIKALTPGCPDTPAQAANDLLLILSPPLDLVDYLDRLWAGRQPPDRWVRWLERWRAIRGDEKSDIDYVSDEEWEQLGERVRG